MVYQQDHVTRYVTMGSLRNDQKCADVELDVSNVV